MVDGGKPSSSFFFFFFLAFEKKGFPHLHLMRKREKKKGNM